MEDATMFTPVMLTLDALPDEILVLILELLDAREILALNRSSKRFTDITNAPLLWRTYCQRGFRYWNDRAKLRNLLEHDPSHQWKDLFATRTIDFKATRRALREIIENPVDRSERIQGIVEHGYQVKDALIDAYRTAPTSPDHLAQRYWSWTALGCLHRSIAIEEWKKIRYRSDVENPTERGLAALDMFILGDGDGDIDDIFDKLNSYVIAIRAQYPDLDEQTPTTRAITILSYLRDHELVGIHGNRRYHNLDHMFLGVALFSSHKSSLPLISAVIYSYICRQFGLRAQPIGFPMHVYALIQPSEGFNLDGEALPSNFDDSQPNVTTHLYMDPHKSTEPVSLDFLKSQLSFIDARIIRDDIMPYLRAATPRELLFRSAKNIMNSSEPDAPPHLPVHPISSEHAIYGAYFVIVTFPMHPAELRRNLTELTQHFLHAFDHDIHIFRSYIVPLTSAFPDNIAYRKLAQQLSEQELQPPVPKLRSQYMTSNPPDNSTLTSTFASTSPTMTTIPQPQSVKYRVGTVFRHRRQRYLGAIYGWDPTCRMSSQWITMNGVDGLPRGRTQPFYHVFVQEDRSTRYVAEENVILFGSTGNEADLTKTEIDGFGIEIGKWFKRFDWDLERFVSNVRGEYPED